MGLDMYLEKCNIRVWEYRHMDIDDIKKDNKLYAELSPYIVKRGKYMVWESLFTDVGYWRKANAIHRWFVENVQDGEDDCEMYVVEKEALETLLDVCKTVLNAQHQDEFESIAMQWLPTQDGFFFGGTDYDNWYIADLEDTINIIEKVLAETDFDNEVITYQSSW